MSMHKLGKRLWPAVLLALILALTSCASPPGYLSEPTASPADTPAAATAAATTATTPASSPADTSATATSTAPTTAVPSDALAPSEREPSWITQALWASGGQVERDEAGHALVNYRDMAYTMPDFETMDQRFEQLAQLAGSASDADALFTLYDEVLVDYGMALTQFTLVSIASDLDVNDEAASQDKIELEGKLNEYYEKLGTITTTILESGLGEEAAARWGQEYVDDTLREAALTNESVQPLMKQISALTDEYQQVLVNHTVQVEDEALTLNELTQRTDLGLAYYGYLETYYDTLNKEAGEIFLQLVELRNEMAQKLGYDNFVEYSYASYNRDYTPEDAANMASAVKEHLVPLHAKLGLNPPEIIYQGSLAATTPQQSIDALKQILPQISEDMAQAADFMLQYDLYDFTNGASKMDGGYTTDIAYYGVPFINYKSIDGYNNVTTVFHEFGHFYNSYCFPESAWNKATDLDLAEIHSQGLELLLQLYYDELYGEEVAEGVKASNLQTMISTVISGCMEDEFQQRLYAEENLTLEKLNAIYEELLDEYHLYDGYYIPNSFWAKTWVAIHHTFQAPLYYISYATSLAAALEIWELSERDPQAAIDQYLRVQQYSTYEPFQATLEACGLSSPFEEGMIESLAQQLTAYFEELWQQEQAE